MRLTIASGGTYLRERIRALRGEIVDGEASVSSRRRRDWQVSGRACLACRRRRITPERNRDHAVPGQPIDHPSVLDGRNYCCTSGKHMKGIAESVCVIGSGETAASS